MGLKGVTYRQLRNKLENSGWHKPKGEEKENFGHKNGNHDIYIHSDQPGVIIPVGRHTGNVPRKELFNIAKIAGFHPSTSKSA